MGDAVAPFIGAPAGTVSMCENVTAAHMAVLSTLPPPGVRDAIVCSAADFPSMIYLFRAQEALGYRLVIVAANDDGSADPARIAEAIDDRTALVAVSHVLFRSSFILDPAPIVERARRVGAPVVLDLYQAAGIIPVDVAALGVDFAAGGCLKWLCGGPGQRVSLHAARSTRRPSARALRAGRHTRSRLPSTSTPTNLPPTIDACRPGPRRSRRTTRRCPALRLLGAIGIATRPRDIGRDSRGAC